MKKLIILALFAFILCGCRDVYDEVVLSDIVSYDHMWDLPERRANEISSLFPASIKEMDAQSFLCKHTTHSMVGTGWQTELVIRYTEEAYGEELARLEDVCKYSAICGESEYFIRPAYATVWNWNGCYEYAIVDEENYSIAYLYLQLVHKEDLVLQSPYVSKLYKDETDTYVYSVYDSWNLE